MVALGPETRQFPWSLDNALSTIARLNDDIQTAWLSAITWGGEKLDNSPPCVLFQEPMEGSLHWEADWVLLLPSNLLRSTQKLRMLCSQGTLQGNPTVYTYRAPMPTGFGRHWAHSPLARHPAEPHPRPRLTQRRTPCRWPCAPSGPLPPEFCLHQGSWPVSECA